MRGVPAPDPASSAPRAAETLSPGAVPHRDDLDVLIPTRDRAAALAVTLAGLLSQDLSARLVLADQTPGSSSVEQPEIASLLSVMRLRGWEVEVDHRQGPGRGVTEQRQHLLDRARRTYLLMLDDDVLLERWVLRQLIEAMDVLGCGFVGMAHAAASYLDDVRPAELETFELWPGGRVEPERIRKGDPAWERWRLHNAANVAHLLDRLPPGALDARGWAAYKVAWVAGCVLFRTDALRDVGGYGFWADLPHNLRGEDVVTQLQVAEQFGGAGLLPSGAWHLELPTSIEDRGVDAYTAVLED
jgi:GT2 family glycosyltransferase